MARPRKNNLPKYVYRKRLGVLYFERRGEPSIKLKCQNPDEPEFHMEYADCLAGKPQQEMKLSHKRDMAALIDSYVKSSRYRNITATTAKDYDKVLVNLKEFFGEDKVSTWRRKDVIKLRDANQERFRFANYCVQVIRILFEHAIDLGWIEYNPASGVTLLKTTSAPRLPWPDHLIEAYRKAATGRELLLFEMCLATGQRIQDVLDMKWTDIRPIRFPDGIQRVGVDLVQNKTGKVLWVPLRDSLVTLLSNTKRQHTHILTNRYARGPWSYRGAAQAVMKVREQIGAKAYDIHSLRYSAACEMAIAGLSDEEIGDVTGQTKQTVQHYTKSVRQIANATRAIQAREKMLLGRNQG